MKRTLSTLIITAASASAAFASDSAVGSGFGLMTLAFLGFFALIVATQLLPGLILFITGAKSIFGKDKKEVENLR